MGRYISVNINYLIRFCFSIEARVALSPTENNPSWQPSAFGIWQDSKDVFTGYLPDVDDKVWHYGPARLWSKPIHRSRYGKDF